MFAVRRVLIVSLLWAACDWTRPDVDGRLYACTTDATCGPGWTCISGVCVADGGVRVDGGDAAVADSGTQTLDGGDAGAQSLDGGDGGAQSLDGGDGGTQTPDGGDGGAQKLDGGDGGSQTPDAGDGGEAPDGGDAGLDTDGGVIHPDISLELDRDDAGNVVVLVRLSANDAGFTGGIVDVEPTGFDAGLVVAAERGGGRYAATIIVPAGVSGEMPIQVSVRDTKSSDTTVAVLLRTIADGWMQPESVRGFVNTPGTEDSIAVTDDGQWLLVSVYSPVDLFACSSSVAGRPRAMPPECQTSLGPYGGPERPQMPGADRILSSTRIRHDAPRVCASPLDGGDVGDLPDGGRTVVPLPPTAAYGFRRQPGDSFAAPFIIDIESDGIGAISSLSVAQHDGGATTRLFLTHARYGTSQERQPWVAELTMGRETRLGTYVCDGGVEFTPRGVLPVVQQTAQDASHARVVQGVLVTDRETSPAGSYAAPFTGTGVGPWLPVALPSDARTLEFWAGRYYYSRNRLIESTVALNNDLTSPASFGAVRTELAGEATTTGAPLGSVIAVTHATFARDRNEMYFVYVITTPTGFNAQVGKVRRR